MLHLPWNKKHAYSPLIPVEEPTTRRRVGVFKSRSFFRSLRIPMAVLLSLSIIFLVLLPRESYGHDHSGKYILEHWKSLVREVQPLPCHSHNDYWRSTPLWAALGTGCTSVEADVWLNNEELYVAHAFGARESNKTLSSLYIEPLKGILETSNCDTGRGAQGPRACVFAAAPQQSLVLLIDFKTSGDEAWVYVNQALEPLRRRGWLAHWNGTDRVPGPVTVVGSGEMPSYDTITSSHVYRDIFLDAPLKGLKDKSDVYEISKFKYNPSNSHYASASLFSSLSGLKNMRRQIREAKARGLVPRYFGTPGRPPWFRHKLWRQLLIEGVGVLNVDDLAGVRKLRKILPWGKTAVTEQRGDRQ